MKDGSPNCRFAECLLFPLFVYRKTQPLDSISSKAVCLLSQFIGPLLIGVLLFCSNYTVPLMTVCVNQLTPNDYYMGRTAQLFSRCSILYIYSTNIRTEYFKHAA